jgi:hypothetical protein
MGEAAPSPRPIGKEQTGPAALQINEPPKCRLRENQASRRESRFPSCGQCISARSVAGLALRPAGGQARSPRLRGVFPQSALVRLQAGLVVSANIEDDGNKE